MPQCTAHNRKGERCKKAAMRGMTVCRNHGGASLIGMANPRFKDGRHSRDLPTRLYAKYEEARKDPELLGLRDDIALVDARLSDLLNKVDSGESGEAWKQAKAAYVEFQENCDKDSPGPRARADAALMELGRVIDVGLLDFTAWTEIHVILEQRRRLVDSERKRLVDMQHMISAESLSMAIGMILGAIKTNVSSPREIDAILRDLGTLVGTPSTARKS